MLKGSQTAQDDGIFLSFLAHQPNYSNSNEMDNLTVKKNSLKKKLKN
jgi:hypothetical protein